MSATLRPNPCANGHPELALLMEVTRLGQRLPEYRCNRCGALPTYEQAIRNQVAQEIAVAIEALDGPNVCPWTRTEAAAIARDAGGESRE